MAETINTQSWMDTAKSALERANELLAALSVEQKIQMALASTSEAGKVVLGQLGIPALEMRDGPNGVRGETGITTFPSAQALAATFNRALARDYGAALGEELRGKGANTWLGPAMDICRTPLAGRQAEALGEDPYLAGQIASAEVQGAKSRQVIAMLKHFIANNQEYFRTGYAGKPPFGPHSPAVDVRISEEALQEIYYPPMKAAIQSGGADAVMISYNRVNGLPACENPHILDTLRHTWGFQGFTAPDFAFAIRDPLAAALAGLDLPALSESESAGRTAEMFTTGQISPERLDEICRRLLFARFDAGLFDHPLGPAQEVVSTPAHQNLARRIAEESMVLLKNDPAILPLAADGALSIAVIGAAREDVQWMIGGSAGVTLTAANAVTPLAGIHARLDAGGSVRFAQGSLGDVPLPPLPDGVLTPPDGKGAGLLGQYWNNPDQQGQPLLERVDPRLEEIKPPDAVTSYPWSARWIGTIRPTATGLYRFALLTAGIARLYINEQLVASGYREATRFFFGPMLPIQGTIHLTAGSVVPIRIEYNSGAALFGGEISLGWQPPEASLIPAAVEAARQTAVAIVFANTATGEGMDRTSLSLPGDQDELIQAVAQANPRTIVVLNTGGPVLMPWLGSVAAVLQTWYPGEQYGAALARVLFGDADPAGRLPVTFPANEQQGPAPKGRPELYPGVDEMVHYDEGVFVGYRWYDQHQQPPLFPFGHGLSYARFAYSELAVQPDPLSGQVEIRARVENIADRAGCEVVQLYLSFPDEAGAPPRQLKGFEKCWLAPGESRMVCFTLSAQALQRFDPAANQWKLYPGTYEVSLGSCSRQLHLSQNFDLTRAG